MFLTLFQKFKYKPSLELSRVELLFENLLSKRNLESCSSHKTEIQTGQRRKNTKKKTCKFREDARQQTPARKSEVPTTNQNQLHVKSMRIRRVFGKCVTFQRETTMIIVFCNFVFKIDTNLVLN